MDNEYKFDITSVPYLIGKNLRIFKVTMPVGGHFPCIGFNFTNYIKSSLYNRFLTNNIP